MKAEIYRFYIAFVLLASVIFAGCKKDITPVIIPEATVVNKFVWQGLHDYYLWNHQVPDLVSSKYNNADTLNLMLNQYSDPQKLFTNLLYLPDSIDKWSFLVDSASIIDNWISGTSTTMGFDIMLYYINSSSKNLVGFVRYVYKGSPAEAEGIKRGDIFLAVNGQQLTDSNYKSLLFNLNTYSLGLATFSSPTFTLSGKNVTMTAIEMQENPINKDTIFTYNHQKVGYLVYNGFNADFDLELNDVFGTFKNANIEQLVIDLRYNGGGSVQSANYMGSMIYETDPGKIFDISQYNAELESFYTKNGNASSLYDYFTGTIAASGTKGAAAINTLNMKKVYFIVSDNTASASELLINALKPYMDVVVVGINTVGKYVGSATIKDWEANGNVNPNDSYAMQPIVVKFSNSAGVTDFVNGLTPDIHAAEDMISLMPFGDPNEKLLRYVLADMSGTQIVSQTLKSEQIGMRKAVDSHKFKPFAHDMYINPGKLKLQK